VSAAGSPTKPTTNAVSSPTRPHGAQRDQPAQRHRSPGTTESPHSRAEAPDRLAAAAYARQAGRAALHGDAHHQVRDILTQRIETAAAGKADQIRAENAARTEFITRRRGTR